jgi:hypothetical protein
LAGKANFRAVNAACIFTSNDEGSVGDIPLFDMLAGRAIGALDLCGVGREELFLHVRLSLDLTDVNAGNQRELGDHACIITTAC